MALIIYILITLGIITSSDHVSQQIIDDHQTEINDFIINEELIIE